MSQGASNTGTPPYPWAWPNQPIAVPTINPIPNPRCMQIVVPLPVGGNETVVRVKDDGSYTVKVNEPLEE